MNKKNLLIITEQQSLLKDIQNIQNSAFNFVKKYYLETHRFYHTTKHIKSMCFELNKFDTLLSNKVIIYLAIMFHDVVYNPKDKDENNVINSSIIFFKWYEENKIYIETTFSCISQDIDKCLLKDIIYNLILSTIGHTPNSFFMKNQFSKQLKFILIDLVNMFLDLDLMILAADKIEYQKYAKNILKEYSHYEKNILLNGRLKFLQNLLKKKTIFLKFYNLNNKAINNIKREIKIINLEILKNNMLL